MAEKFLILGAGSFYGHNFAQCVRRHGDEAVELLREDFDINQQPLGSLRGCSHVVNFISKSLVAESWDAPESWCHTNLTCTTRLFESLRSLQVGRYVHVSTPEVYGSTDEWVEETYTDWKPSTPYAVSRAAADMMLMAYHRAYGLPAIITRTANIYGEGQGANRFIPLAFDTFRRGVSLLLHGGGHTKRAFIHVKDACEATYRIAKTGTLGHTYHISSTEALTIKELAVLIAKQCGLDPLKAIGSQPDRLGKDPFYLLSSQKTRNLGWRDTITLTTGLQNYGRRD